MLRSLFLLTFFATASTACVAEQKQSREYPTLGSRHFSLEQILTGIELPFLAGMTAPSWPFLGLMYGEPETLKLLCLFPALLAITKYSALGTAHIEWLKATCASGNHKTSVSSFFKTKPADATYNVTVTLEETRKAKDERRKTLSSTEKKFENTDSHTLIQDILTFATSWTHQHNEDKERELFVFINATVTTKQGKPFVLTPLSLQWDERVGIERDLRELLLVDTHTHTTKAFRSLGYSIGCAALGLLLGKVGF